jgi:hypothetical protein
MSNVTPMPKSKLSLDKLTFDLGITPDNLPRLFTECFKLPEEDRAAFTAAAGGLSKTIWNAIKDIDFDMQFESVEDFRVALSSLLFTKISKSKAYKISPLATEVSLGCAVAFLIIRRHPEAEKYESLMRMRHVIEESANLTRIAAKGASKGPNKKASFEAAIEVLTAANCVVMHKSDSHDNIMLLNEIYFDDKTNLKLKKRIGKLLKTITLRN